MVSITFALRCHKVFMTSSFGFDKVSSRFSLAFGRFLLGYAGLSDRGPIPIGGWVTWGLGLDHLCVSVSVCVSVNSPMRCCYS